MTEENEIWPKYSLFYIVYQNVLDNEMIQKNIALQYLKYQSCLLGQLCNIEFLQVSIVFFSNTVRPRNIKLGLNIRFSIYFFKMF